MGHMNFKDRVDKFRAAMLQTVDKFWDIPRGNPEQEKTLNYIGGLLDKIIVILPTLDE